jgi:hypothetical protein
MRCHTLNARSSHWSGFDFDCEMNWDFWAFHKENFSAKSSKALTACDLVVTCFCYAATLIPML